RIKAVDKTIRDLNLSKRGDVFDLNAVVRRARGDSEVGILTDERQSQLLPRFKVLTGGIDVSQYANAIASTDVRKKFSLEDLQEQGAALQDLVQNIIAIFQAQLTEESTRLQKLAEKGAEDLRKTATARIKALQ